MDANNAQLLNHSSKACEAGEQIIRQYRQMIESMERDPDGARRFAKHSFSSRPSYAALLSRHESILRQQADAMRDLRRALVRYAQLSG